jgi:predicted outer membrane repeat protein
MFQNNHAESGGGVYCVGHISVANSTFTENRAARDGGAIYLDAGSRPPNTSKISDSLIVDNSATSTGGGLWASPSLSITRGEIRQNRASYGGGIWGSAISVSSSVISNNSASVGGGVYGSHLVVMDTVVSDNSAKFSGAGIFSYSATIRASSIHHNSAGFVGVVRPVEGRFTGGGIKSNLLVLEDSCVFENFALDQGGGIYAGVYSASVVIRNSTISDNVANEGAGIYGYGHNILHSTFTRNTAIAVEGKEGSGGGIVGSVRVLSHSIVAGNADSSGQAPDVKGSFYQRHHSLIGDNRGNNRPEAPVGSPDANGNLVGGPIHGVIDPKLGPLADNGGPTLTHLPLPGSPVIDAGDPSFEPGVGDAPEFDQRGAPYARIFGGRIDIGAYECQEAAGAFIADFNGDGFNDGADFLIWQRNLGNQTAEFSQGDATGNGLTDANDLAVWRKRYPETPFPALEKLTLVTDTTLAHSTIDSKGRVMSAPEDAVFLASSPEPQARNVAERRAALEISDALEPAHRGAARDSAFEEFSQVDKLELDLSAWN